TEARALNWLRYAALAAMIRYCRFSRMCGSGRASRYDTSSGNTWASDSVFREVSLAPGPQLRSAQACFQHQSTLIFKPSASGDLPGAACQILLPVWQTGRGAGAKGT